MTLACIYLLMWDFTSLRYIIIKPNESNIAELTKSLSIADSSFWIVLGFLLFITTLASVFLMESIWAPMLTPLAIGVGGCMVFFLFQNRFEVRQ